MNFKASKGLMDELMLTCGRVHLILDLNPLTNYHILASRSHSTFAPISIRIQNDNWHDSMNIEYQKREVNCIWAEGNFQIIFRTRETFSSIILSTCTKKQFCVLKYLDFNVIWHLFYCFLCKQCEKRLKLILCINSSECSLFYTNRMKYSNINP